MKVKPKSISKTFSKKTSKVNPLNKEVLILNKSFLPIGIDTAKTAILNLYKGKCQAVDATYKTYTFDEWKAAYPILIETATEGEFSTIHTPNFPFLVPYVFRLLDHDLSPRDWKIRFSRFHVLLRDKFVCQYCTEKFTRSELTIDHVTPRSKGGITSWDNCVTACKKCNRRKADKTPAEAGMKLIKENPGEFQYDLRSLLKLKQNKEWENFL